VIPALEVAMIRALRHDGWVGIASCERVPYDLAHRFELLEEERQILKASAWPRLRLSSDTLDGYPKGWMSKRALDSRVDGERLKIRTFKLSVVLLSAFRINGRDHNNAL
jgi:hypothetical protein